MQRSSVGSPCWPDFGPEGRHFVSGNADKNGEEDLFLEFWRAAKLRLAGGGGAQRPVSGGYELKDGGAQRTGAHARPKPTSFDRFERR